MGHVRMGSRSEGCPRLSELISAPRAWISARGDVLRADWTTCVSCTPTRERPGWTLSLFDLVIAADLFEHLYPDDSERVAHEAYRVLKPGGHFTVWTPHRGHLLEILKNRGVLLRPDPTHVDYKSMERLQGLLTGAGFTVEKSYYVESHLPGLRLVERVLMGAIPQLRRRIALLGRKS